MKKSTDLLPFQNYELAAMITEIEMIAYTRFALDFRCRFGVVKCFAPSAIASVCMPVRE